MRRCPGVFRPGKLTKTSLLLAENMVSCEGFDVLDVGCGTGILSLLAARKARRVVAVDVNPKAVECTRLNAEANGLESRVDVRLGSLFQPLKPGEAFNLILFNPPYLPGKPGSLSEAGWLDSGEVTLKFLGEASKWLKPGGLVQLVYSSLGALSARQIVEAAEASSLKLVEQKSFRSLFETFTIHVFALKEGGT
ncbi:MAG: HemK2/MTQ2 family protein methyltransferase [Candidatus Hecatellaceae archaeon]